MSRSGADRTRRRVGERYRRKGEVLVKRFGIVAILATALLVQQAAMAANPHWVVDPYCSLTGQNSLECSGKAAGLGNLPLFVVVTADAGCTNQSGTHVIPGKATTVSGPFSTNNGQFTFGAEDNSGQNEVVAHGPTNCKGRSQDPFITTSNVVLRIYECAVGSPTFHRKTGAQTNPTCTLELGPTTADIV